MTGRIRVRVIHWYYIAQKWFYMEPKTKILPQKTAIWVGTRQFFTVFGKFCLPVGQTVTQSLVVHTDGPELTGEGIHLPQTCVSVFCVFTHAEKPVAVVSVFLVKVIPCVNTVVHKTSDSALFARYEKLSVRSLEVHGFYFIMGYSAVLFICLTAK